MCLKQVPVLVAWPCCLCLSGSLCYQVIQVVSLEENQDGVTRSRRHAIMLQVGQVGQWTGIGGPQVLYRPPAASRHDGGEEVFGG